MFYEVKWADRTERIPWSKENAKSRICLIENVLYHDSML